jgi:hypothetical protein
MAKKKKSKVPADVARRMALVGDDQATLQQKAKKELHKARVRLDRLLKSVNGDTDKLSYNAKIAIGILSPFMNKEQTKVSERVTGYNKDVLINAIMRAEKFNAAATTVTKNRAAVEKEQRSSGLTKTELERRKRYWRIANYAGLLDFFAASDANEDEDVYRIVTEAEEQNLSDEEFTRLVHEKINKKRGTGFDMWGNEFSNEYSNTWGENVLKTRQHEFTIGESGALEIAADALASSAEWVI